MASLVAASYNSSGEEEEEEDTPATTVDYEESAKLLSSLKERFPLDSAPAVPNRVR